MSKQKDALQQINKEWMRLLVIVSIDPNRLITELTLTQRILLHHNALPPLQKQIEESLTPESCTSKDFKELQNLDNNAFRNNTQEKMLYQVLLAMLSNPKLSTHELLIIEALAKKFLIRIGRKFVEITTSVREKIDENIKSVNESDKQNTYNFDEYTDYHELFTLLKQLPYDLFLSCLMYFKEKFFSGSGNHIAQLYNNACGYNRLSNQERIDALKFLNTEFGIDPKIDLQMLMQCCTQIIRNHNISLSHKREICGQLLEIIGNRAESISNFKFLASVAKELNDNSQYEKVMERLKKKLSLVGTGIQNKEELFYVLQNTSIEKTDPMTVITNLRELFDLNKNSEYKALEDTTNFSTVIAVLTFCFPKLPDHEKKYHTRMV